jgi:hypothetical protein
MATVMATKSFFLESQTRDIRKGQVFQMPDAKARVFVKLHKVRIVQPEPALTSRTLIHGVPRKDPPETLTAIPPRHPEWEAAAEGELSKPKAEEEPKDTPDEEEPKIDVDREQIVSALRERARALGVDVDGRWGEARLREEIEEARKVRYERRDMRPQE